jgi:hypothetical protein
MSEYKWASDILSWVNNQFKNVVKPQTPTTLGSNGYIDAITRLPAQYNPAPAKVAPPPVPNPKPLDRYTEQMKQMPIAKPPATLDFGFDLFNTGANLGGYNSPASKDYGYDYAPKSYSSGGGSSYGGGGYGGTSYGPSAPMPDFHAKAPSFSEIPQYAWNDQDPANIGPITAPPAPYTRDIPKYKKLIGEEV